VRKKTPLAGQGLAVGLLGGSFNPAHAGHRRISELALKRLGLDAVWWLVSPQNPLKPATGMAPFAARLAGARALARHPRIRVSDIEAGLGTRYSVDTIRRLQARHRRCRFVWIMGADNLAQLHAWHRWPELLRIVPVAIFARPTYSLRAFRSPAAKRFARFRKPARKATSLVGAPAPAWAFVGGALDPLSATAIRQAGTWSDGAIKKRSVT